MRKDIPAQTKYFCDYCVREKEEIELIDLKNYKDICKDCARFVLNQIQELIVSKHTCKVCNGKETIRDCDNHNCTTEDCPCCVVKNNTYIQIKV